VSRAGLLAAILSVVAAAGLVRTTGPGFQRHHRTLGIVLAASVGVGLAGVTHLFRLLWIGPHPARQWLVDAGLVLVVAAFIARADPPAASTRTGTPASRRAAWLWTLLLAALLALGAAAVVMRLTVWPHGPGSDSVAIWTLKARMLFRDEASWLTVFDRGLVHSRYPLLVPALTARLWVIGGEGTWAPRIVAAGFLVLTVALLVAGLRTLRGPVPAAWAGLTLLLLPVFLTTGTAEIADVPLACFALATLVTLSLAIERPEWRQRPLLLTGLITGLAALTKTEGQVLPPIALLSLMCARGVRYGPADMLRSGGLFLLGAGPLFAAGLLLTLHYATVPSEYTRSLAAFTTHALDASRHWLILEAAGRFALAHPELALLAVPPLLVPGVRRPDQREAMATVGLLLGGIAAAYYLVYLTTPYPLEWQLGTSFERLVVQYWPASIWWVFLAYPVAPAETMEARRSAPIGR
jgi:4-amino-4-deoxy-L-arabinose transferase-like glycosyltransferase